MYVSLRACVLACVRPWSIYLSCSHGFDGELETVKYSNQTRDSFLRVPLEVVIPFYKALRQLNDLLYRPENKIAFCLDPGKKENTCIHTYTREDPHGFEDPWGSSRALPLGAGRLCCCFVVWEPWGVLMSPAFATRLARRPLPSERLTGKSWIILSFSL